ncbi:zinc-dependent metalloprotease [Myxococcus qinghaiensis]|uniref:zinc-dependent metalloprotease n=1 Tax=Myxococcus qinghaiensis TaxID=2906758 RepID=UPI0020A78AED|nr:zinc-dependent metalloprotease [Myxococcus qinghaiensis]MCP3162763.1 zinc-dependent metalloprotease [Myxococcus qinghaiensis]
MRERKVLPRGSLLGALLLTLLWGPGCGDTGGAPAVEVDPPEEGAAEELDGAFVAVPRTVSAEVKRQAEQKLEGVVEDSGTSFYLAIRKSELGQRWFLSAYLTQNHPGGVYYNAASSLGTRVVSFKEQNGKLFVLDVDDRKVISDVFEPQVLVEAYPIVTDHAPFNRRRSSDKYVLIDPTAGFNRFGVMGDLNASLLQAHFQVELSFAQRLRPIADGVTFEQVFTGYSNLPDDLAPLFLEENPFRTSGTLSVALRRYKESPGYVPTPPPDVEHYFLSEEKLIPNTGSYTEQVASKWAIYPGMTPIRWNITSSIHTVQNDPRFQEYDVVGAVKRGIENWNTAFGFKALEAVVADGSRDFGDDDENYLIFDPDPWTPFAFANWRSNPNTGEVRGASVYMSNIWLETAHLDFEGDVDALAAERPVHPLRLTWSGMGGQALCDMRKEARVASTETAGLAPPGTPLTKKQKVEAHLTQLVLHEIGHTLGLRHNFAGSNIYDGSATGRRSSSVMDYTSDLDNVYGDMPGPYDVQAVRYLYGLSPDLPTYPFCTDPDTRVDPTCNRYDRFDEPLTKFYVPALHQALAQLMAASPATYPRLAYLFNTNANSVFQFVRAGSASTQLLAYQLALQTVRPPLVVPPGAPALHAQRADDLARRLLSRLYLDPAAERGVFSANPSNATALLSAVLTDVQAILLNTDGVRGYAARRTMVDILKAQQTLASYSTLASARDTLTAQLPSLGADDRLQTADLIARITAALSPYYR